MALSVTIAIVKSYQVHQGNGLYKLYNFTNFQLQWL